MNMSKTYLGKIFRRTEIPTPRTLLLTDSAKVCGRGLLYALVNSHLGSSTDVLYLTTCLSPQEIRRFVKEEASGKLEFYNGAKDPCGWDSDAPEVSLQLPLQEILRHKTTAAGGGKVAIVVDRLEDVNYHQESSQLVRSLHMLSAGDNVEQVIVYCGRDVVPESMLAALCHIAAATVHLLPTSPCSCRLVLRKPSGKVIKAHEEFTLTPDLQVQDVQPAKSIRTQHVSESSETDVILAAQTTFSLALTEDQRIAKNSLLLPHTRVQTQGGHIHYTPDDVDDWDDDDPDDDLDI
ncbi:elongator complex protein 5-like [Homarus americanus]|uniref:Elongator complex protein 5 n=1 Tax=Homarus americanus TaxID=6706 RepID=A0A8J5JX25_HOMAM|nr:elongator complex protein 5-like [Homarus americanus]KAG7166217.1 Elongator complex protein 5-like [Homarus americanus]